MKYFSQVQNIGIPHHPLLLSDINNSQNDEQIDIKLVNNKTDSNVTSKWKVSAVLKKMFKLTN